ERRHPSAGDRGRAVRCSPTVPRATHPTPAARPSLAQPAHGAGHRVHRLHHHQPAVRPAGHDLHRAAADRGDRGAGDRPDLDHPHRRHRSRRRGDLDPLHAADGQPGRQQRRARSAGPVDRHRVRHSVRVPQRPAGHPAEPAPVHRHAGHAQHLHRDRPAVLRRRQRGQGQDARHLERDGHPVRDRAVQPDPRGAGRHPAGCGRGLRAQPDRLGSSRLRRRRRHRRRPAGGHPGRPGAAQCLHRRGADLRLHRLDPDRTGGHRQPQRHRRRQPGDDHRRGDRRHQPVRRSRRDHRHHSWCPDRVRLQHGAGAGERRRPAPDPDDRRVDHRRRLGRPVDQKGQGL
ncbi:MAG: Fructose ABC transporter, permease component FrcC, partial [uncultured Friedmanniella sp.]